MMNTKNTIKRVMRLSFLLFVLVGLANCNQFASFSGSGAEAHLSKNPVFENPNDSFQGNDNGTTTNNGTVNTNPNLPPFKWCPDGRFQVLLPDGSYTPCRSCVAEGTRTVNGINVPVCEVQRCDQTNQYIFFGNDPLYPSTTCDRCDRLANDQRSCQVRVVVAPAAPPAPPVVDTPAAPTPTTPGGPTTPVTPVNPSTPAAPASNDDGGDGGGDPLMIDTVGELYTTEEQLLDDNYKYFESGTFKLTYPQMVRGMDEAAWNKNQEERQNFQGFNLLGQQSHTVLDDGDFLHLDHTANPELKNFKFREISWTRPGVGMKGDRFAPDRYRFLALPNDQGQVLGIDQLFGDNTYGPWESQPFARDGFRALMKHDMGDYNRSGNQFADGYIDQYDAVFNKLRLWHDVNGDGNCDTAEEIATELVTLSSVGIAYIHLVPNEKFWETDKFGNDIAYKSIVGFHAEQGQYKLGTAFDLWLQYDPRELSNQKGVWREDR